MHMKLLVMLDFGYTRGSRLDYQKSNVGPESKNTACFVKHKAPCIADLPLTLDIHEIKAGAFEKKQCLRWTGPLGMSHSPQIMNLQTLTKLGRSLKNCKH